MLVRADSRVLQYTNQGTPDIMSSDTTLGVDHEIQDWALDRFIDFLHDTSRSEADEPYVSDVELAFEETLGANRQDRDDRTIVWLEPAAFNALRQGLVIVSGGIEPAKAMAHDRPEVSVAAKRCGKAEKLMAALAGLAVMHAEEMLCKGGVTEGSRLREGYFKKDAGIVEIRPGSNYHLAFATYGATAAKVHEVIYR